MKKPVLIIAEAGVNHNGDLALAKQLIDAAADAGADVVKFQTFSADRLVTRQAKKASYQSKATGNVDTQHQMLSHLELSASMHRELIAHCAKRKLEFFSTGFDIESVNFLISLGIKYFKIPSGEITNLPYLRHIGQFRKPVIISTGMATMSDVEAAIDVLEQAGTARSLITVLHCTTEYPTPFIDVNLRAMKSIEVAFGVAVGYSDHSAGIEVAIAAAALGATVIEKHFTLDKNLPGPDHKASLEPDELKAMVSAIRNIEIALGDGIKRITLSERLNKTAARKSLVAIKDIKLGEVFSVKNVAAKRPGSGLSPMTWDSLMGRKATRDFLIDELIEL
jgi:N,N'-diacetyllegionaminate synthase